MRSLIARAGGLAALLVLVALLAPALLRGVERVRHTLPAPSPDDGLEGTLLFESRLVRDGAGLYRAISDAEFVSAPYTPLHPIILAATPLDPARPFSSGRLISLLAMAAVALCAGLFVAAHSGRWWLGGAAAAFLLAFAPVQLWGTRLKPDALALALTALGLLLASLRRGRWADWAALAFALAFMTKQTALIAPFAVGLNLLFADWRRAARYALVYGLALGLPYLALDLATGGLATAHIWGLHRSEWWRFDLFWKYVELLRWSLPLLALALLALAATRRHPGAGRAPATHNGSPGTRLRVAGVPAYPGPHACRQALLYALLAPLTLYGAGEIGAHHNHLLETMLAWTLAGCLGAGLLLGRPDAGDPPDQANQSAAGAGRTWRGRALGAAALLGLAAQALCLRTTPAWYGGEFAPPSLERYAAYLASKPGEVLADNPGIVMLAGKPLRFDDPSTMGPAIRSAVWDPSVLHQLIRERHFSAILLEIDLRSETSDATGRWTDETLGLIKEHYDLEFTDTLFAYVPKNR